MRTESKREKAASVSRRAFLIGAGAAVAAPTTGTAAGADGTLTVEATDPYLPTVRRVVDDYERDAGRSPVDVRQADGGPVERVADGPVDVHVSGRPDSPAVVGQSTDVQRDALVHGWATLAARSDDWYESIRGPSLRDRVDGDRPVETWSETDWESVTALEDDPDDGSESDQCAALADDAGTDRTTLVRGTRAFQYAQGLGGLGFYEVGSADVGAPSAARSRGDEVVPLARLGYVTVAAGRDRSGVDSLLEFYRERATGADELGPHAAAGATPNVALSLG